MPHEWRRDDRRRLMLVTITDPVDVSQAKAMLDEQVAEGTWRYGALVDARRAILSSEDDRILFEHVQKLAAEHGPAGPVALVTRDKVAIAQRYAMRSTREGLHVEVFWDIGDAERWLLAELARQPDGGTT